MTLTESGKQWIAQNLGINNCFVKSGLSWTTYNIDGSSFGESGGTASLVGRLVTTTVFDRVMVGGSTYRYSDISAANGGSVTLADASYVAQNDGYPAGENQYCVGVPHTPSPTPTPTPAPTPTPTPTGLTEAGKRWIAENLGINNCIVNDGLTWITFNIDGSSFTEHGGTASIVGRLITTAVFDRIQLISPITGTYRYDDLKFGNQNYGLSLTDASWVAKNDGYPVGETQYCTGVTPTPTPTVTPTPTPGTTGNLQISSTPTAKIKLDNADYGYTPKLIEGLYAKSYNLELTKSGYQPEYDLIRITAGQTLTKEYTLDKVVTPPPTPKPTPKPTPTPVTTPTPTPSPEQMPINIEITSALPIPLWYEDSTDIRPIPATRLNPVRSGTEFSIAVSEGGKNNFTTIFSAVVDDGAEQTIPFETVLGENTPAQYRGTYKGEIVVNGFEGTIQVNLIQIPGISEEEELIGTFVFTGPEGPVTGTVSLDISELIMRQASDFHFEMNNIKLINNSGQTIYTAYEVRLFEGALSSCPDVGAVFEGMDRTSTAKTARIKTLSPHETEQHNADFYQPIDIEGLHTVCLYVHGSFDKDDLEEEIASITG